MITAVIISRNQKRWIEPMLNALGSMPCVFVFDRCTDGSEIEAERLGVTFLENKEGEGRQCGRSRNLGAGSVPNDDVLFMDADRIPNFDVSLLNASPFDVTLVKCEEDIRDDITRESWVPEKLWGTFHNGLFGSCVLVRRTALDRVLNKYGYLYDTDFTQWGEEDRHFGDLLVDTGADCGVCDDSWRVSGYATHCNERIDDFTAMAQLRVEKLLKLGLENLLIDNNIG